MAPTSSRTTTPTTKPRKTTTIPKTITPDAHTTRAPKPTKAPLLTVTPIDVPDFQNASELANFFLNATAQIRELLTQTKSVSKLARDQSFEYMKAMDAATKSITEVMAPTTVVNNISSTDLLASIRQVVQDEISAVPSTSYANALAQPPVAQNIQKKNQVVSRPAIIVASRDANQKSAEVLDAWRKGVSFRDKTFAPARIQTVSHNKIRIEFDNERQRDEILERTRRVGDLDAEEGKRRRPMMIIKGINNYTDKDDLVALIKTNNTTVRDVVTSDSDIRFCFARRNRNENRYNAVIEVTPAVRRQLINLGRVGIDHQRVHVGDFSPFLQCYTCLQFGHTKNNCPEKDNDLKRCSYCASTEHSFKDCPDEIRNDKAKIRCFNCHQHNVRTSGRRPGRPWRHINEALPEDQSTNEANQRARPK